MNFKFFGYIVPVHIGMLLTPHTIVGVAVATSVPEIGLAVPISFVLHFLGDMVPHWDFYSDTTKEERIRGWRPLALMADLAIGVAVGMTFTLYALWVLQSPQMALNIFLCGIASVLPDAITGPSIYIKTPNGISKLIHKIQGKLQYQIDLPWGIVTQILVTIFALLLTSNSVTL